jgi:hypothetical protein
LQAAKTPDAKRYNPKNRALPTTGKDLLKLNPSVLASFLIT